MSTDLLSFEHPSVLLFCLSGFKVSEVCSSTTYTFEIMNWCEFDIIANLFCDASTSGFQWRMITSFHGFLSKVLMLRALTRCKNMLCYRFSRRKHRQFVRQNISLWLLLKLTLQFCLSKSARRFVSNSSQFYDIFFKLKTCSDDRYANETITFITIIPENHILIFLIKLVTIESFSSQIPYFCRSKVYPAFKQGWNARN